MKSTEPVDQSCFISTSILFLSNLQNWLYKSLGLFSSWWTTTDKYTFTLTFRNKRWIDAKAAWEKEENWFCFHWKPGPKRPEKQGKWEKKTTERSLWSDVRTSQGRQRVAWREQSCSLKSGFSLLSFLSRYARARLNYYFEKKEEYFGLSSS